MTHCLRRLIRKDMLYRRSRLSASEISHHSTLVCHRLKQMDAYRYAKHLGLYYAVKGEICLDKLWRTAAFQGKYCYFPVVKEQLLYFLPATPSTPFKKNHYGILEPDVSLSESIPASALDVVLVPLVAFDPFGIRIGMGKGYYDRTFSEISSQLASKVMLIGVAHDFQKQAILLKQPWDVLLNATVTEKKVYWASNA